MGGLFQALIQEPPQGRSTIHLRVEARKANGKTSILFTFGSPELPSEYSTLVPDAIANAAFHVINLLLQEDDRVPGFEVALRQTGGTKWDTDFHRLDEPGGDHWSTLPRFPLRVCGYGFSLAPPPDRSTTCTCCCDAVHLVGVTEGEMPPPAGCATPGPPAWPQGTGTWIDVTM